MIQSISLHGNNGSHIHSEVLERRLWSQTAWVKTPSLLLTPWGGFHFPHQWDEDVRYRKKEKYNILHRSWQLIKSN